MISDFNQIEGLFKEIDKVMYKKVKVYIIGGAVLLKQGIKPATKDIDLVVETKEEFIKLQKALEKLNFQAQAPGQEYKHMNLSQIFQKDDFRIDIFHKEVCAKFSLSQGMVKRAKIVIHLNHISVFLCSNEDVFLFKTMTEREGDLIDCISIARRTEPDWDIILEELKGQISQSKQDVWITWVGERLDILEDRGLVIPIMKEVDKLMDKFFDDLEKKQSNS